MHAGHFNLGDRASESFSPFVTINFARGVMTIRPTGPSVGQREAPIIASEVKEALKKAVERPSVIVIDLSDVQILSSFGLSVCIELRNSMSAHGVSTVLYGLTDQLGELFRMLKIDRLYRIARTPHDLARAIAA